MARLAMLVLFLVAAACPVRAADRYSDYLAEAKQRYENFLIVKIFDARTMMTTPPAGVHMQCYFRYNAEIVDKVKGKYDLPVIGFFSEVGLAVGQEYLIQFTDEAAKRYRRSSQLADMNVFDDCKKQMTGRYLLYQEINPIQEFWDGKQFVRYVQFSDPWAEDLAPDHSRTDSHKFVDFSYVRSELLK